MPIGDQSCDGISISADDLRCRYNDLIKEALLRADPTLEVVRADEIATPGTITTDIITRIMHSDFILADITYPNANVFYELGLRHACRNGTIIIRDRNGPRPPFDIAHLRHFEYENTPTGLKDLAMRLVGYFQTYRKFQEHPDSHFLEIAKLTNFEFPNFTRKLSAQELTMQALMGVLQDPELMTLFARQGTDSPPTQTEIMLAMGKRPEVAKLFLQALISEGQLSLVASSQGKKG